MEQTQNDTPKANRIHIGFFGRCNVGKSSLINAIAGQPVSIVSETAGTTTDPVEKAMELLPLGAVLLMDTPGLDDTSELGQQRIHAAYRVLEHTDLAVLVVDASFGKTDWEDKLEQKLRQKQIPYVLVWNKWDKTAPHTPQPERGIVVSASLGTGISTIKQRIVETYRAHAATQEERTLFGDFLSPQDVVLLVTPIDSAAPKGRMILPQVQAIRSILDSHAVCMVTQPEELVTCLHLLKAPPKLIVTDSQAFGQIKNLVPPSVPLTSFSILFARYKGVLEPAIQAVHTLDTLPENSHILISEGCTHHRQCEDIGTVKLPRWIQEYTGKTFQFSFTSGKAFPEDLSPYAFVVHCGGCMLHQKEMAYRAACAKAQKIPFVNYGILIAYCSGGVLGGVLAAELDTPI